METEELGPTKEEIMQATYRALGEQGYVDLTMQDIADEFEKSKSLLYYHYDNKETLLADFLGYALREFVDDIQVQAETPREQIEMLVERLLPERVDEQSYRRKIAMLELRAETPHNETYKERFTEVDGLFKEVVADIIRQGIDDGQFQEVDPDDEAELLVSLIYGVRSRRLTTESFPAEDSRRIVFEQIGRRLFRTDI